MARREGRLAWGREREGAGGEGAEARERWRLVLSTEEESQWWAQVIPGGRHGQGKAMVA